MSFFQGLVFGQVREDAAAELWVARQRPVERGVIVASAGCTAFALAGTGGEWTAVDSNPAQLHLCALRRELLLAHEELGGDVRPAYARVRARLQPEAQGFWDRRASSLERGLNRCGRVDRTLDRLAWIYRRGVQRRDDVADFLRLSDPAQQRRRFDRLWDDWRWRWCFQLALAPPLQRWIYGSQARTFPEDFGKALGAQVRAALCETPASTNRALWQTFLAQDPPGWPAEYERDPERTRAGLAHLRFARGELPGWLEGQRDLDFFGLSNVAETMDEAAVGALARAVAGAARPGALVVLRRIIPRSYRPGAEGPLRFREDLTREARARERGCFCRTVEVYEATG